MPYLTEHFLLCTTIELYRLDERIWEPEAEKGVEGGGGARAIEGIEEKLVTNRGTVRKYKTAVF